MACGLANAHGRCMLESECLASVAYLRLLRTWWQSNEYLSLQRCVQTDRHALNPKRIVFFAEKLGNHRKPVKINDTKYHITLDNLKAVLKTKSLFVCNTALRLSTLCGIES